MPPILLHLLLVLASALLGWAGTDFVPFLSGQGGYAALAASAVTMLMAWLAPFVQSYGIGKAQPVASVDNGQGGVL